MPPPDGLLLFVVVLYGPWLLLALGVTSYRLWRKD